MDLHHARDPFSFTGCTPLSPSVIRDAIDVAFNVRRSSMAGRQLVGTILSVSPGTSCDRQLLQQPAKKAAVKLDCVSELDLNKS